MDRDKFASSIFTTCLHQRQFKGNVVPQIRFIALSDSAESYLSTETDFLIGRSEDCHIQILDEEVSRHHARVTLIKERYVIENLGLNPVEINGQPIKKGYLENEDHILFGQTQFLVRIEEGQDQKEPTLRLVLETESGKPHDFSIKKDRVIIGRSADADIHLDDQTVSRRHCAIEKEADEYVAVKLSEFNPLLVNNKDIRRQRLYSGDQLQVGPYNLVFISSRAQDLRAIEDDRTLLMTAPLQQEEEDKTIVMAETLHHEIGPRLVLETLSGQTQMYPLNKDRLTIGRSAEADIHLDNQTVSRMHCAIEKEADGYVAVRLSPHSPVIVNNEEIDRLRLYSGDQIQLGADLLSFMSDIPKDTRPETVVVKKQGPSLAVLGFFICLFLIMGGYLAYRHVYAPWETGRILKRASLEFSFERYESGRKIIEGLLAQEISAEDTLDAKKLLANSTLKQVRLIAKSGNLKEAKQFLAAYLKEYGGGKEASLLWDEIDQLRFAVGQELEDAGKPREALREYSLIRADSLSYTKAQKSISRIWLADQQQRLAEQQKRQTLAKLLQKAETSYKAQQYLAPLNNNAYSTYQAVLAIEPNNSNALERIKAIKSYFLRRGTDFFAKKKWTLALESFESYALIDPANPNINNKIFVCRNNLAESRIVTERSSREQKAIARDLADEQQRIAEQQKRQTVAKLLQKAERNFKAKQYLRPMNNNAYSLYQAVLAIDPDNAAALEQIGTMQSYFKNQGSRDFDEKAWEQALASFESYALMNPDDAEVREKIKVCQNNLAGPKPSKTLPTEEKATASQQERIKRMLEDSGTESTWIMKYLFEEEKQEKQGKSETPW